MRRRSRAGRVPAKAQRRKTAARKSRIARKATRPRSPSAAREETKGRETYPRAGRGTSAANGHCRRERAAVLG
jgi:hypothetical protein